MTPRRFLSGVALTLFAFAAPLAAQVANQPQRPQVPLVPAELIPPSPALSPEEELKTFQIAPGVRVELVASEPMVAHPVAGGFGVWVGGGGGVGGPPGGGSFLPRIVGLGLWKCAATCQILTASAKI